MHDLEVQYSAARLEEDRRKAQETTVVPPVVLSVSALCKSARERADRAIARMVRGFMKERYY